MSDKREDQPQKDDKPWEKTFSDNQDLDQEGNLSRTKHRKQNSHNSMITTILVLLIVLLAATPVIYWINHQSSFNHPNSDNERVAQTSSSSKSKTKQASTTTTSTSVKTSKKSASTSQKTASSSQSSASDSSSSSSSGAKYITVPSGQGLYRVAVNNGLTVDELRTLNGLSSGATLQPGQRLRVK